MRCRRDGRGRRIFHGADVGLHRLLHLLESAHFDLAHAFARHAEFVGELFQRDRVVGEAARGTEPSTITKMALGCFGVAISYLIMAAAGWQAGGGKASWLWLFGYFVVITVGELYLSPVGLSLVTKIAPARILSMMMGVWLATSFIGGFLAGWLGSFWSRMEKPEFFLMVAAIAALAGVVIFACRWLLHGMLQE